MQNVNSFGNIKIFRKSQLIFDENVPGDTMYILRRGKVKLSLGGKDGIEIITLEQPDEFFGEMALIDGSLRSGTAVAAEDDTELEVLDRDYFLTKIKLAPDFAQRIMIELCHRLRLSNDHRLAEERLKIAMVELDRSNKELEQFAYVTSHDLREPLRMMTSFSQLLKQRYQDKLDLKADEYINFIVDGGERMQRLIDDILLLSRVTTRALPFKPVDMEKIFQETMFNLKLFIQETNATITHDSLPIVQADSSQMIQVLQNLISNAIKFHKERVPPVVHVSAVREGNEWIFSIKDNGIGINPELFGRLFNLFQRLHPPDKYPGTGVGLAVAKKIIQRHKGRIWVESQPEQGATFFFSLPVGLSGDS